MGGGVASGELAVLPLEADAELPPPLPPQAESSMESDKTGTKTKALQNPRGFSMVSRLTRVTFG